jgi:hypothetical protein
MRTMSHMVGASYRCRGISGANKRTAGLQAWHLGYLSLACALYVFRIFRAADSGGAQGDGNAPCGLLGCLREISGSKDSVVDLIGFELPTTRLWPLDLIGH